MNPFSFRRFFALLRKEWTQVRRDPMTLRLIIALPVIQLVMFSYALNANPKDLPTGVLMAQPSKYERTILSALRNTGYFDIHVLTSEAQAERGLADGSLLFVINFPAGFDRDIDRGERPSMLIDADGTDPSAIGNATASLAGLAGILDRDLPPNLQVRAPPSPFQFVVHTRYNPEQLTAINIIPGLICVVLMLSTQLLTSLAITRERELGTMENLLAMPVRPIEVMLAKITPYIAIGYVQVLVILAISSVLLHLPMRGSIPLLLASLGVFIGCNLGLGITFSTIATTQSQAQQMAQFTILPFMLLSGFFYPFLGMPHWAQAIGKLLPTTHAMHIVRGILLKGNGLIDIVPDLWPMALFLLLAMLVAVRFYKETLD